MYHILPFDVIFNAKLNEFFKSIFTSINGLETLNLILILHHCFELPEEYESITLFLKRIHLCFLGKIINNGENILSLREAQLELPMC